MGKNSRRRHLDKKRRANERRRRHAATPPPNTEPVDQPIRSRSNSTDDGTAQGAAATHRQLEQFLGLVLRDRLWARGWQPDELLRHVRRSSSQAASAVVAMAIADDAAHHDRVGYALHDAWRRQADRILAEGLHEPGLEGWIARWLDAGGDGVDLATVCDVLDELVRLPSLPVLIPPPGSTPGVDMGDAFLDPTPKLRTIRGLLAKAESTEFPAEAEAFTVKAQAMMADARIDEATVRARTGQRTTARVSAVRIGIDAPYVASKQMLLHVVAEANDVRCVFHRSLDLATLVGPVGQLVSVELLFTSLLIQVNSFLVADAATVSAGSLLRSRSYRSSFIMGFAQRIGERLQAVRRTTFADARDDALPVLTADDRATTELFDRLIGRTTKFSSSSRYDAVGARAGARAADRASLRESGLEGRGVDPSRGLRDAG